MASVHGVAARPPYRSQALVPGSRKVVCRPSPRNQRT
jgi:hypothetical protein